MDEVRVNKKIIAATSEKGAGVAATGGTGLVTGGATGFGVAGAFVQAVPPLVVAGAVSYAAAHVVAGAVNGIMNILNLGGSNVAGTTENATMLNPQEIDPELMDELYLAADSGELVNPGSGEPITREMIDNGEAFYPDYLLRQIAEEGHGLDFTEAIGGSERRGDGSAGLNVGGTKLQAEEHMRQVDPMEVARTVSTLGLEQRGLKAFAGVFKAELQLVPARKEFNKDPTAFLAKRGWRIQDGLLLKGPQTARK